MIITAQEKQVLQKYYAERIKSLSQILNDIIQQDKQDVLNETLRKIDEAGLRIVELQQDSLRDLEQELKDRGSTVDHKEVAMTGGKIYG